MNSGYYHRQPTSARARPLPQNRQAFGTVSQRARPGVNSAQPLAYQGSYSSNAVGPAVRPGTTALPQFGQQGFGAQAMGMGMGMWQRPAPQVHSSQAFSPLNPGPVNPYFHGGLPPTQQQRYDNAMALSRQRYLLNPSFLNNRIAP